MNVEQIYPEAAERLRRGLNEWAEEGSLPAERSAALADRVRRGWGETAARTVSGVPGSRRTRRWAVGVAAAAALLLLPLAWEPARAWATDTFPAVAAFLGLKAQVDPGWAWALEHEGFQEVLAQAEDRGYTFRVHRVLADPTQTTIVYTISGPDPAGPDFMAGATSGFWFDGKPFTTSWSGEGSLVDGVYVGVEEVDPLPEESGTLRIVLNAIGDVRGRWVVEFPVTRQALTAVTRTIPVRQPLGPVEVGLELTEVLVLPTRTELRLSWAGAEQLPPGREEFEVRTQSGHVVPWQGRNVSSGEGDADGNRTHDYRTWFDPLPPDTTAITVHLKRLEAMAPGERLSLPLMQGATAEVRPLPLATVRSVSPGSATVEWAHDREHPFPYEGWMVIDDRGEVHQPSWEVRESADGATMIATVTWDDLPAGRSPAALEARWIWRLYKGDWQLEIPLD